MIRNILAHGWANILALGALGFSLWLPDTSHQGTAYLVALLLIGPFGLFLDGVVVASNTRWQLCIVIATRCVAIAAVGSRLCAVHATSLDPILFAVACTAMHFAMLFHANDRDTLSVQLRYGVFAVMMIDAVLFFFVAIGPHPQTGYPMLTALWMMATFALWRFIGWQTLGVTPLSSGQQQPYWSRYRQGVDAETFWAELHRYVAEQDASCSQQTLDAIVGMLPMQDIRAYFESSYRHARNHEVQAAYERLAEAARTRMMELDPRTIPIWAMCSDWASAMLFINHLDDMQAQTILELPALS